MTEKLKPFINIGPGQIIARNLAALNWSNKDLAEIIGMSEKTVSQLIHNKQSITVETAILLGRAFQTSPEFWMNLDQNYRLRNKKEGKKEHDTEIKAKIRKYVPLSEMKKKGWITYTRTSESQIMAYRKFWNCDNLDFLPYEQVSLPFCARQSRTDEVYTRYYSITWFQKAKTEAKTITVPVYSESKLRKTAKNLKDFSLLENSVELVILELAEAGVKFFTLSHLPKTFLDGASFFDGDNPVIVYTGRYNRFDNFWWTVTHEISHILLHLKDPDDCFLDNFETRKDISKQEKEADLYTGEILRVKHILKKAEKYRKYLSEIRLLEIAADCGLEPSLVLGILQYNDFVDYRTLPRYRKPVLDLIPSQLRKG